MYLSFIVSKNFENIDLKAPALVQVWKSSIATVENKIL